MTNKDFDFETWFESLQNMLLDRYGFEFSDSDSVREDYDAGKNFADVSDDIAEEFSLDGDADILADI